MFVLLSSTERCPTPSPLLPVLCALLRLIVDIGIVTFKGVIIASQCCTYTHTHHVPLPYPGDRDWFECRVNCCEWV
jgi:hypothetical protein